MSIKKAIDVLQKNSLYLLGLVYLICLITHGVGEYILDFIAFFSIAFSCISYSKYMQRFSIANLIASILASLLGANSYAMLFFYFFLVPSGVIVIRSFFRDPLE